MPFLFPTTYLFVSVVHVPFGIFSPRRPRRHVLEWSLKIQAQFLLCSTRTCTLLYPFTRSLIKICPTDSLTSLYAFKWTPHMSPLFDKGEKKRFTSRSFSSAVALKFCSVSSVSRCVTSISYGHTNPDAPFPWFASSKSYSRRLSGSPSSLYAAWAGNQARRTLKESNRRGLAIMLAETTCLTDSHLWPTGPNCSFQSIRVSVQAWIDSGAVHNIDPQNRCTMLLIKESIPLKCILPATQTGNSNAGTNQSAVGL
jgi:hypothetical protein